MALARMSIQVWVGLWASAMTALCSAHNFSRTGCIEEVSSPGTAMLQITKGQQLQQAGNGSTNPLNEVGYQKTAQLCCHHEMTVFIERVLASLGNEVCDTTDFIGLVHWYDCTNDGRSYTALVQELQKGTSRPCPWLGTGTFCPVQDENCDDQYPPCPATFPPQSEPGSTAALSNAGYYAVTLRECDTEMKDYILREIQNQGLEICDQGALQGLIHWYDSPNDGQTYDKLATEIAHAHSGNPCPWLAKAGEACPVRSHNCPVVGGLEGPEPAAHRRRTACR